MAKISERAIQMKVNFMRLHDEGKTIPEIAEIYSLSAWTVYEHLQSIANDHNVSRKSLLSNPHKSHEVNKTTLRMSREHVDIEEIRGLASDILTNIDKIVSKVDTILQKENIEN